MKRPTVGAGARVEVSYKLYEQDAKGELLETCGADEPFSFEAGAEEALAAFEAALDGLEEGANFSFSIDVKDAYGPEDDSAYVRVPKTSFLVDGEIDESLFVEGEVVPMETEEEEVLWGVIVEVFDNEVEIDFNHPFAGVNLYFEGCVERVSAPVAQN